MDTKINQQLVVEEEDAVTKPGLEWSDKIQQECNEINKRREIFEETGRRMIYSHKEFLELEPAIIQEMHFLNYLISHESKIFLKTHPVLNKIYWVKTMSI